ncbi:hypothetical protein FHS26_001322 [Rhizobium pisi]|uniref:Uncharacterized protein n=1 Tax=Rhizobium pisi TaxID=574561 RepID=A0A7W5FYB4_9HYPH|nr:MULTISPECIES: hypothetical protein [Rhizobium]MBB3133609.1 hypothetical protein [Rhizobium pisi]
MGHQSGCPASGRLTRQHRIAKHSPSERGFTRRQEYKSRVRLISDRHRGQGGQEIVDIDRSAKPLLVLQKLDP